MKFIIILKKIAKKSKLFKRIYYAYRRSKYIYPDWKNILYKNSVIWEKAKNPIGNKKKILLATSFGGIPTAAILDSFLAIALTLRGAEVHILLCDKILPACLMTEVGLIGQKTLEIHGPKKHLCKFCHAAGRIIFNALGLKIHQYGDFLSAAELGAIKYKSMAVVEKERYELNNRSTSDIWEQAVAGSLRYFASSYLASDEKTKSVFKNYYCAAAVTENVMNRLLSEYQYDVVSCINGIYIPQGIVASVARSHGTRVTTWNVAYRKKSFVFSHNDTYHHTLMNEPVSEWENMDWSDVHEKEILNYLNSRRTGGRDWIAFQDKNPNESLKSIAQSLPGINFSRPCIGMLTNVAWDAQLHYPANVFPNMLDWVLKTIEYFVEHPTLQLIIRIHPAEISGDIPSRQPVLEEINKYYTNIPNNIFIIRPESKISTYAAMEACNAVIIYGTKTGVELTSMGIPVIVAGEAWIRNKGITIDAKNLDHYYNILDKLPLPCRMTKDQVERARKYAYHFFFRRMIPISQMEPTGGEPQFKVAISTLDDLLPGKCLGLDIICDGILNGAPFIYPAEKFVI